MFPFKDPVYYDWTYCRYWAYWARGQKRFSSLVMFRNKNGHHWWFQWFAGTKSRITCYLWDKNSYHWRFGGGRKRLPMVTFGDKNGHHCRFRGEIISSSIRSTGQHYIRFLPASVTSRAVVLTRSLCFRWWWGGQRIGMSILAGTPRHEPDGLCVPLGWEEALEARVFPTSPLVMRHRWNPMIAVRFPHRQDDGSRILRLIACSASHHKKKWFFITVISLGFSMSLFKDIPYYGWKYRTEFTMLITVFVPKITII